MADDLFDGVKPPKEPRPVPQEAPAAARETAPSAGKGQAAGVPLSRLWWWAVPLLLVVAAIVLWSVSVWLLLAVAAAAVLGVVVAALVWWWQRRGGRSARTTRTRSWTSAPPGRTGRGAGVGGGLGLGGRSAGAGRRSVGRPASVDAGRRAGSRWNPSGWFKGGRGPKGSKKSSPDGQAAGSGGHARGGRLRSLLGGRGVASSGRPSGGGNAGGGRQGRRGSSAKGRSESAAGGTGSRWSRSRANPVTWLGPRRSAAKAEREARNTEKLRKKGKDTSDKKQSEDKPERGKRRWWPWGRKKTADAATTDKADGEKPKAEDAKKAKKKPTGNGSETEPKAEQAPMTEKQTPTKQATVTTKEAAPDGPYDFDDMGFPTRPDPNWKPPPRTAPRPLNVDDGGFLSPITVKQPKVKAPRATNKHTQRKGTMTDRTKNPYAHMIDPSTPETFRFSVSKAAEAARKDAEKLEAEAAEVRSDANAWLDKGVEDSATALLAEAARLEETAQLRRAAAAGYESV